MSNSLPNANEMNAVTGNTGAAHAPDFLVRSRHEVIRLLTSVMANGTALSIKFLHDNQAAASTLIDVDEPGNRLLFECVPEWRVVIDGDAAGSSIMVDCALDDSKIEFQGEGGEIVDLDGTLAVALAIPDFMWRFQRRHNPRHKVSGLKITLNLGFLESDAEITDLGMGGIGVLNCDGEVKLEAGETLKGCAIVLPGVGQIAVDLTVQYQMPTRLADGREVARVGCQFTRLDDSERQLIAHYLEALAKT